MQSTFPKSSVENFDDAYRTMNLYVWGPAWGLPSIDAESIQSMAYARFSGAPVKIIVCNNPWKSEKSTLPFFKHGDKLIYSAEEMSNYLRQRNYTCDYGLTSKQNAEIIAYTQLIAEALHPALQFFSFIHEVNFQEVIRPCYGQLLPWFYKMWYADRRLKESAHKLLEAIYREAEFEPESFEPEILVKAQRCIKILSDKLGTNEYFINPNSPSKLDAVIFCYLSPFIKIPWQHCPIKEYIKATPNLERYVARVNHRYFSTGTRPGEDGKNTFGSRNSFEKDIHGSSTNSEEESVTYPMTHKFLAFFVATTALLFYAYRNGMFRSMIRKNLRLPADETYYE